MMAMYTTLIEENRELRDSNKYLREKLSVLYAETGYYKLLKTYQSLLVKNATQQQQIDQLEGTIHRLSGKDKLKW
jgi:cell division septum initiation protein DivIVA